MKGFAQINLLDLNDHELWDDIPDDEEYNLGGKQKVFPHQILMQCMLTRV